MRVVSRLRSLARVQYVLLLPILVSLAVLTAPGDAQTLSRTLNDPNPQTSAAFGGAVAVGDVNGDGKGDIVVGADNATVGGNTAQGRAYVFSGANGALLFTLDTPDPQASASFGSAVAVGDVNGDGKGDIVVGAPGTEVDGNPAQGRVYVFSGASGALLLTLDAPAPESEDDSRYEFGRALAVGDVNGDGKGDIVVGSNDYLGGNFEQGRAYVFSGPSGALLLTLDTPDPQMYSGFGTAVAVGDVNHDGKGDIAVGAPKTDVGGNSEQGRAYVFSGANGALLITLDTPDPTVYGTAHFGQSVAVGDVNTDGKGDIVVGAPIESVGDFGSQGRGYVFSGANGALLRRLDDPDPNPTSAPDFGWAVAVGDVNGDGSVDVVVGAMFADVPIMGVGDNSQQGRAYIFSGADGSLLLTLDTPDPQGTAYFGASVAVSDVNGGRKGDIVVGAPLENVGGKLSQGRAYVFSSPSPVGGIAEPPDVAKTSADEARAPTEDSGWSAGGYAALAGGLAATAAAIATGGWYARRRRHHRAS